MGDSRSKLVAKTKAKTLIMKSRNNILLTLKLTCIIRKNGILKYKWECNGGLQWECVSL